jgi:putative transposase
MPNYRRALIPGGCWFFTVNLLDRRESLLVDHIDRLRDAVAATRNKYPFEIDAFVALPDHLHAIWTLPPDDADFSIRWRLIKTAFAKSLPARERRSAVRAARNERGIWQRRFWEHLIRNEADYARHIEYCYINPVKHGLVTRVRDWPHSSFHRDVGRALFPARLGGRCFGHRRIRRSFVTS